MSLSREFAAFVAGLRYEDLPAAVVDRAKGVTLQALSSAAVAHDMPASRQALALMQEEEAGEVPPLGRPVRQPVEDRQPGGVRGEQVVDPGQHGRWAGA